MFLLIHLSCFTYPFPDRQTDKLVAKASYYKQRYCEEPHLYISLQLALEFFWRIHPVMRFLGRIVQASFIFIKYCRGSLQAGSTSLHSPLPQYMKVLTNPSFLQTLNVI